MAQQYTSQIKLQFTADTSSAQKSLQNLSKSLKEVTALDKTGLGHNLSASMKEAISSAKTLQQALQSAVNVDTGKLNLNQFMSNVRQAGTNVNSLIVGLQGAGSQGAQAFKHLASSIAMAEVPIKRMNGLLGSMMTSLANTVKWQISSSAIHGLMSGFSSAVGYTKDLNASLNNIRIVTGQSVDDMARFAEKANAAAKALSTTTNAYAKASLIYYQQGDSAADAARKAEITLKAANASFHSSAEEMSEYLTAVWNSYQVGADELERYVDIMAALGAKTATSLEEIATSMQKVAATANTVGVSMEQVSSIISTVSSVTRESAESIGTSFKTIFARIGDLKLGDTLEDGVGLGQVSSALKKINVDILDSAGNMREMGDIITDLGNKWQTLSQAQKTATAQVVAGKRQYTQLMALFENWDMYNKSLNIANNADGELQKQANIYAQSWEGASNRVRAAWEGVWGSLIDDEALIDMMNKLAEFIGGIEKFINNIGGMAGVMSTLGSVAMSVFGSKIAASIDSAVMKVKDFGNSFAHIEKGWSRVASFFTKNTFQRNMEQMTKGLKAGMEVFDRQAEGRLGTNPSSALKSQISMERAQLETTGRLLETKNQLVQIQGRLNATGAQTIQNEINGLDNVIAKLEEYKQAHQKAQGDIAAARNQLAEQGVTRVVSKDALSKAPGFSNLTPAEQARFFQNTAVLDAPEKNLFSAAQGNATQAAGATKLSSTGMQDTYAQQTQMVTTYKQALDTLQAAEQKVAAVQGDSKQAMQQKANIMTDAKAALTGYARAAQDAGFPEVAKQITTMANGLHNSSNITTQAAQAQNLYNQSQQTASEMAEVLSGKMGLSKSALESFVDAIIRSTSATLQSNAAQEQSIVDQQRLEAAMKKAQRSIGNSVAITTQGIMNMGMAFNSMSSLVKNFDESSLGDKLTSVAMTVVGFTKTINAAIANPSNPLGWIMIALQAITTVLGAISGANEKAKEEQKKVNETARKNLVAETDALREETNATKELLTNFNSLLDQKRQGLDVDEELQTAATELAAKYNITGQALNSLQGDYEEFIQAIQANALDKQISDATTTVGVARGVIGNNSSLFDNEDDAGGGFGDIGYNSYHYGAAVAAGYNGVGGVNLWSVGINRAVTTQDFGGRVAWSGSTGGKRNRDWFKEVGLEDYILDDDGQLELLLSSQDSTEYKISTYEKLQSMYDNLVEAGQQGSDLGAQVSLLLELMSEEMDAYYSAMESLSELKIQRYANQWVGRTYESTSDGIAEFAEDYNSTYQVVATEIKETYMKANNISNANVKTWTEEQQQEYQSKINNAMQTIVGNNSGVASYFSAMQTLFNAYDSDLEKAMKALEKITKSIGSSRYSLNIEDIDAEMAEMYQLTGGVGEQWNAYLLQKSTSKILDTMKTVGESIENLNMSDDMTYSEMSTFFTEYETLRKELYEKFGIEIKTFDELMLLPWEERMAYIDSIKNGSAKAMAGRAREYAVATAAEANVYWDTGAIGTDKILKYDSTIAHTLFDNLGLSNSWNAYEYNRADGSVAKGIAELTEADWIRFDTMLQQQNSWDAEMLDHLYDTDAEGRSYLRGEDEVVIQDGVIKIKIIGEDGTEEWSTVKNSAEWLASSTGQQVRRSYQDGEVHSFYQDTAARQDFAYGSAMNRAFGLGLNFTEADRHEIAQMYGAWTGYKTRANTAWDNNETAQEEIAVYEALEAQTNSVTNSIKQLVNVLKDLPTSAEEFSTVAEKLFGDLGENAEEILANSTDKMRAQAFLDNNAEFKPDESQFQMTTYKNWATGEVISEGEYQLLTVPEQGFYNKGSGINWAGYSEARTEWIKGQTAAFQILSQDDVDLISEYSSILNTLTSSYKTFIETGSLDAKTQQALLLAGINPDTIETIEDYEQAITTAQKTVEQSTNNLLELMQNFTKDIEIDWSEATIGTTWEEFISAQNEEIQKYLLSDEGSWLQQFYEQWHTSAVTSSTALDGFNASAIQTATATTTLTETLKQQQEEWNKVTEAAEKAKGIIDSFASDSSNITFEQIHELKNNILDAGLALEDFESYISVLTDMNASEEAKTAAMRTIEGKIGMANVYNAYDQALPYMSTTIVIDNYLINGNKTTTPIEEQYNTQIGYGFTATGDIPDGAAADIIENAETGESGGDAGTATYTYTIEEGAPTSTTIYDDDDFAIVERINNANGDVNVGTATYSLVIKNGDGTTQNIDLTENQKWLIDNWDTLAGDSELPLSFIFTVGQIGESSLPSNWETVYNSFTTAMTNFTDPDKGGRRDTIPLSYYFRLLAEVDPNDEEGVADFDWMYLVDEQGNLQLDDNGNPQFDIGLINLVYDYQFIPAESKNPIDELRKNIWEITDLNMDLHPDPHNLGLLTYTADMLFVRNENYDDSIPESEDNPRYELGEDGKYKYKPGLDLDLIAEETQYTMYWRWQYHEATGNDCPPGHDPKGEDANYWAQFFGEEKAQTAFWAMQHLTGSSTLPPGFKENDDGTITDPNNKTIASVFVDWSMRYAGENSVVDDIITESLADQTFPSEEAYDVEYSRRLAYIFSLDLDSTTLTSPQGLRDALDDIEGGWENAANEYGIGITAPVRLSVIDEEYQSKKNTIEQTTIIMGVEVAFKENHRLHRFMELYDDPNTTEAEMEAFVETLPPVFWKRYAKNGVIPRTADGRIDIDEIANLLLQDYGSAYSLATTSNATMPGKAGETANGRRPKVVNPTEETLYQLESMAALESTVQEGGSIAMGDISPSRLRTILAPRIGEDGKIEEAALPEGYLDALARGEHWDYLEVLAPMLGGYGKDATLALLQHYASQGDTGKIRQILKSMGVINANNRYNAEKLAEDYGLTEGQAASLGYYLQHPILYSGINQGFDITTGTYITPTEGAVAVGEDDDGDTISYSFTEGWQDNYSMSADAVPHPANVTQDQLVAAVEAAGDPTASYNEVPPVSTEIYYLRGSEGNLYGVQYNPETDEYYIEDRDGAQLILTVTEDEESQFGGQLIQLPDNEDAVRSFSRDGEFSGMHGMYYATDRYTTSDAYSDGHVYMRYIVPGEDGLQYTYLTYSDADKAYVGPELKNYDNRQQTTSQFSDDLGPGRYLTGIQYGNRFVHLTDYQGNTTYGLQDYSDDSSLDRWEAMLENYTAIEYIQSELDAIGSSRLLRENATFLSSWVDTLDYAFTSGIPEMRERAITNIEEMFYMILSDEEFKKLQANMPQLINYLIQGLTTGKWEDMLADEVLQLNLGDTLFNTLCTVFEIHSPSRLTQRIGAFIMAGLQQGINDNSEIEFDAVIKSVLAGLSNVAQQVAKGIEGMSFHDVFAEAITSAFGIDLDTLLAYLHVDSSTLTKDEKMAALFTAQDTNEDGIVDRNEQITTILNVQHAQLGIDTTGNGIRPMLSDDTLIDTYNSLGTNDAKIDFLRTLGIDPKTLDGRQIDEETQAVTVPDELTEEYKELLYQHYLSWIGAEFDEKGSLIGFNPHIDLGEAAVRMLFDPASDYHYSRNSSLDPSVQAAFQATMNAIKSEHTDWFDENGNLKMTSYGSDFLSAFWTEWGETGTEAIRKVQTEWQRQKGIWEKSFNDYVSQTQKANEKALKIWQTTFKTITNLHKELGSGKTLKEIFAGDKEGLANWAATMKQAGYSYQELTNWYDGVSTGRQMPALDLAQMSMKDYADKRKAVGQSVGVRYNPVTGMPIFESATIANKRIADYYDTTEGRNKVASAMRFNIRDTIDQYDMAVASENQESIQLYKAVLDTFMSEFEGVLTYDAANNTYTLNEGADGTLTLDDSAMVEDIVKLVLASQGFTDETYADYMHSEWAAYMVQRDQFYSTYTQGWNNNITQNTSDIAILEKVQTGGEGSLSWDEFRRYRQIVANPQYAGMTTESIIDSMQNNTAEARDNILATDAYLARGWFLQEGPDGDMYWAKYGDTYGNASDPIISDSSTELTSLYRQLGITEATFTGKDFQSTGDRTAEKTSEWIDDGSGGQVQYTITKITSEDGKSASYQISTKTRDRTTVEIDEDELETVADAAATDYDAKVELNNKIANVEPRLTAVSGIKDLERGDEGWGAAISSLREAFAQDQNALAVIEQLNAGTITWEEANLRLTSATLLSRDSIVQMTEAQWKQYQATLTQNGVIVEGYEALEDYFAALDNIRKIQGKITAWSTKTTKELNEQSDEWRAARATVEDYNDDLAVLGEVIEDLNLEEEFGIEFKDGADPEAVSEALSDLTQDCQDEIKEINEVLNSDSISEAGIGWDTLLDIQGLVDADTDFRQAAELVLQDLGITDQNIIDTLANIGGEEYTPVYGLMATILGAVDPAQYNTVAQALMAWADEMGVDLELPLLDETATINNSKGGGGGGGGKKKPTERKKYSDVERYHEIESSLKAIENEMSKIEKLRERSFGPEKIEVLEAELQLLQKQKEAQEVLAAEASDWIASDQELLNSLVDGVEYLEDGRIANWRELQNQWIDEYNAAVAAADAMTDDEEKQEALEAAQKEYDRKVEALKNYEDSIAKALEAGAKLEDIINQMSAKLLEKIQYNVEYKMELNESDLEIMEYYLDTFEDDVFKSAESMDNMMAQITTHLDNLQTLKEGYNELIKEYNNGAGLITDADFQAGLKEFQSQIIDTLTELNELKKEMKEFYEDVLENASEELENHTEKLDAIVETMESYVSIQELMGKGVNYEWLTGIYQTQYEANRALLTANKEYLDNLIKARDEATDPDLIEAYNDAIVEANESLLESTEAVLETLQKIYENTVASIFETLDKSLAGAADSVEELSEDYAYYQEVQERYVSTAKELHEVSKLNRDIEKSINETASQTNKNLLKQLQERIKAQSKMNELTQYDLDMNQKQYELLLAKIALEEAQNAKDTVRLVRDANGNYAYQYTADQGKIDEAEQKYEDALYAIHQLSAERIKEMEQEMIDARKTFLDSAKEIAEAEYDSEDERYEDLLKLFNQYKERMTYSYAEYEEATDHLGINAQSFAELFGVSVDEIYGGSSLMNEALGALFALGADATFEDAWTAIQEVMKAAKEREDAVKDATDEAGTSLDGMSGNADQASGAIGGLIGEITDLNTKLDAEFIEVNKVADAWLRLHEVLTSTSLDYEQIAENMQKLQEAIGTEGLGLVLGDLVINGDAMAGIQDTEDQLNPQMPDGTKQYATGGLVDYTGPAWVDGTPDKPELMLNATDTPRFLEAIKIARQINFRRGFGDSSIGQYANIISDTLEASMAAMYDVMANSYHATDSAFRILSAIKSEPIDQNVTIDAHFPSVTNHTEIEDALNNLINQASHFTNRNF